MERETLSPECRRDAARLDALLADDFHEFGRSGGELTKGADTARRIAEQGDVGKTETILRGRHGEAGTEWVAAPVSLDGPP